MQPVIASQSMGGVPAAALGRCREGVQLVLPQSRAHSGGGSPWGPRLCVPCCSESWVLRLLEEKRGEGISFLLRMTMPQLRWGLRARDWAPSSLLASPLIGPRETRASQLSGCPGPSPIPTPPGQGFSKACLTKDARWVGQSGKARPRDGGPPKAALPASGLEEPEPPGPSVLLLEPQAGVLFPLTAPPLKVPPGCPRGAGWGFQQ